MGSVKEDVKDTWLGFCEAVQDKWGNFVQFLRETWPLLLLLFVGLMLVWWLADPPPPKRIVMATGTEGGSYQMLAKKYVDYFAKKGVTLELVPSRGAQENIARLSDRKDPVQAAFVQAGIHNPTGIAGILSLGSVAYEPIWFFYRGPALDASNFHFQGDRLKKILSMKTSIGDVGSGTHSQALNILKAAGLEQHIPQFLTLSSADGVEALLLGEIDVIFLADQLESPNIQKLLRDPKLNLMGFNRAEAYTRILPYLEILTVPTGSFSLVRDFPPQTIQLLSTTTQLLVDDRMHPALQYLFLEAAEVINGKQSFFAKRGEFPMFNHSAFPESIVATRYEKSGVPPIMNYLPFWVAEFIHRMFILIVPFLAFAYPIVSAMPNYRYKRVQARINRMYGALWTFEQELAAGFDASQCDAYISKINQMEAEALKIKVPKKMASDYYSLRSSMDYVRNCLIRGERPYLAAATTPSTTKTDVQL
ncbi:TAXI family TRAP transporter solute-binding subunit [Polynucleobacter difficilis]|uniref:TAXI family TRAP transporter solute-binding subunit n=1 Tax=Polynucleobacter difficilis TaxID=556054 RepID=UPI000D3CDE71|nr:TAXI family TRAP transporter solute-binding subunit [Polynucleobacter difficilis]